MENIMKKYDVVALGELLIDFTENGKSNQGNPLFEANPGGAPCNVLAMLTKLGHKTAFIGKVGEDFFGEQLRDAITEAGIDAGGLCTDKEIHTTLAMVHTYPDGDRDFSFYRNPGADMMLNKEEVQAELIKETKIFHFGTLSMTHGGVREATKEAIRIAEESGAVISFDPNLRPPLWNSLDEAKEQVLYGLAHCQILKISDNEIQWLTGEEDYTAGVNWIRERYQIPLILVSMGKEGSRAYYNGTMVEKKVWDKDSGRMYAHNIISWHKDEQITPEQALEFGKEFAENWFSGFQTLVAVHKDKDHIHCHLVTNSVSYEDGRKLHNTRKDLECMKQLTNQMCRERELTVAEKGKHFDGSQIEKGEVIAWSKDKYNLFRQQVKDSFVADCAMAVLKALENCISKEKFIEKMKQFYNISKYTFDSLLADPENIEANFRDYLNGFSANVQDVLSKFDFDNIIRRMVESNTLYLVIKEFNSQKGYLGPDKISAVDCGYIFEDLVKRFSESFGEEAGAHFTSRDIIYLMTDLLLSDADLSKGGR